MGDGQVLIKAASLGMVRSSDDWEGCVAFAVCVCVCVVFLSCVPFPITSLSMIFPCGFHRMVEGEQDIGSQERREVERQRERESLREFAKDTNVDA